MMEYALPIPKNMAQEWVSLALVRALCAQAGLNISSWEWDDGLDLTIGSAKKGYGGVDIRNVKFHLQVKSTANWTNQNGKIGYRIRKSKYNQLADQSADPQHLVLYTLPKHRWQWVQSKEDHSTLSNCAYLFSFDYLKPVPLVDPISNPDETIVIDIATQNRLTAGELLRLYRHAAEQWRK